MTIYDPKNFWTNLGKDENNFPVPQEQMLKEMVTLKSLLRTIDAEQPIYSVIEVGPGSGRFTKVLFESLPHMTKYSAFELSEDRAKRLERTINALQESYPNVDYSLYNQNFYKIPRYGRADLILASHVLLHIPTFDIQDAIAWTISNTNAKGHIINIDYFEESGIPSQELAYYNYLYNYPKLFESIGKTQIESTQRHKVDDWVSIFHTRRGYAI